jgi:hypothetical protein
MILERCCFRHILFPRGSMSPLRGFVSLAPGGELDRSSYHVAATWCAPVSWVELVRRYPLTWNNIETDCFFLLNGNAGKRRAADYDKFILSVSRHNIVLL